MIIEHYVVKKIRKYVQNQAKIISNLKKSKKQLVKKLLLRKYKDDDELV